MRCRFAEAFDGFMRSEHRIKKNRKVIRTAPKCRSRNPSADYGKYREGYKRAEHAPRRLMDMHVMLVVTLLAVKRQKDQTEHVKRSEQRGEQANGVQRVTALAADSKRIEQDRVFR